jgi:FG-GAP-like repeat
MNKMVEAGGRPRRLIAVGLCLPVAVLANFAIQAGTRGYGGSAVSQSTVMSRPLVGSHVTRADAESIADHASRSESLLFSELDSEQVPPPTRSTFMARWPRVPGAKGYRLDVSSESSFSTFVEGFHDLDVGERTKRLVTGLSRGTTYYYRVRAYDGAGRNAASAVLSTSTASSNGLTILAPVDPTIANKPYAGNIEAAISRAISVYESLFRDPVTIRILFRYATTGPDGSALPSGALAEAAFIYYRVPWQGYINALVNNALTDYDITAKTSLPGGPWSTYIAVSSANGRAVGLDTPGAPFPGGAFGNVLYDGIVTLNSAAPLQFYRPTYNGNFDAQRVLEHEIDEILGLGSHLNGSTDFRPQDFFNWSSPGVRNLTTTGTRYFSIDRGETGIVSFNQNSRADLGDWLSTPCPQPNPYVQNAFFCPNQYSDVTVSSPEAINLDVIGYDLNLPAHAPTDFNRDKHPDYVLYNASTRQTVIWYLNNNVLLGGYAGPTLPLGWRLVDVADFNRDGHPDYALFYPGGQTGSKILIWYLYGPKLMSVATGPTIQSVGWQLVAIADFNGDDNPDYVISNQQPTLAGATAIWYLNNNVFTGNAAGPSIAAGWKIAGAADFNRDGKADYLLFNPVTRQSKIIYLSGGMVLAAQYGPTIDTGYELVGASDFNGDSKPDYVLFNPSTGQTQIWYLDNYLLLGTANGPTLPGGWTLAAP